MVAVCNAPDTHLDSNNWTCCLTAVQVMHHGQQGPNILVAVQVARQLDKVRAEIAAAEAVSSGHASALSDKEKQKKWMKF